MSIINIISVGITVADFIATLYFGLKSHKR